MSISISISMQEEIHSSSSAKVQKNLQTTANHSIYMPKRGKLFHICNFSIFSIFRTLYYNNIPYLHNILITIYLCLYLNIINRHEIEKFNSIRQITRNFKILNPHKTGLKYTMKRIKNAKMLNIINLINLYCISKIKHLIL